MDIYQGHILLLILALLINSGCNKDDEFNNNDHQNTPEVKYPFQRGSVVAEDTAEFNFLNELFGYDASTLTAGIEAKNATRITVNGVDTGSPKTPFTFNWGDSSISEGWFPQDHIYTDTTKNYFITVTSHYEDGYEDHVRFMMRFVDPEINKVSIPAEIKVSIPDYQLILGTRLYPISADLKYFEDSYFEQYISREDLEYILSVVSWIQYDLVNQNVYLIDGNFNQVVLKANGNVFMGSLWFTNPPCFICSSFGEAPQVEYCAMFHESGHGFTLNTPADFYYGGRIDGPANCIYSESMAVIFSLASTWELLNNYEKYGLPEDIVFDIHQNAIRDFRDLRELYDTYIGNGKRFESWDDGRSDNVFYTFQTIAFLFCAHAEQMGLGYKLPAQKMMKLLQVFNEDLADRFDQGNDTPQAERFRSTLLVTALSYAFNKDLREECKSLNFPVDDATYEELLNMVD